MDTTELHQTLLKIDQHLQKKATLHVRGGTACILLGEAYRTTVDIDLIQTGSKFDKEDLQTACQKAGVQLGGLEALQDGKPYIQILPEENLILPKPRENHNLTAWQGKTLQISTPEPADLIVSKLKRCDAVDIQDIAFLILKFDVSDKDIQEAFSRLPEPIREDPTLKKNLQNTLNDFFERFEEPKKTEPCKPPTPKREAGKNYSPLDLEREPN